MRLHKLGEQGGIGFAAFILIFFAYGIVTFVYFEKIRVDPTQLKEDESSQGVADEVVAGPERTLQQGEVLEFTGDDVITLLTNTDVRLLPKNTPKRFVNHLSNTLPGVIGEAELGCIGAYQITKISNLNVSGSIAAIDSESKQASDLCSRGLSVVWYLDEANWSWLSKNFGSLPSCEELLDVPIYSEFIDLCLNRVSSRVEANPNGSIKNR